MSAIKIKTQNVTPCSKDIRKHNSRPCPLSLAWWRLAAWTFVEQARNEFWNFRAYVKYKFLKFSGTVAVQKISESITVGHACEF